MRESLSRRSLLQKTTAFSGAAAAFTIVPRHVLGGGGTSRPARN